MEINETGFNWNENFAYSPNLSAIVFRKYVYLASSILGLGTDMNSQTGRVLF